MAATQMYSSTFYLLHSTKLDELLKHARPTIKKYFFYNKRIDYYYEYLDGNATLLDALHLPGDIFFILIHYLKREKQLDLISNEYNGITFQLNKERDAFHYLFTHQQKVDFANTLSPHQLYVSEIQKFYNDFSGDSYNTNALSCFEAAKILYNNLQQLPGPSEVILLILQQSRATKLML